MAVFAHIPAVGSVAHLAEPLAGIPALAHTILQVRRTEPAATLVVETADPRLAEIALGHGAKVIASAAVGEGGRFSASVLGWLRDRRAADGDVVVRLDPDMPLRPPHMIADALAALAAGSCRVVVSGRALGHPVWEVGDGGLAACRAAPQGLAGFEEVPTLQAALISAARTGDEMAARVLPVEGVSAWRLSHAAEHGMIRAFLAANPTFRVETWPERLDLIVFDFDGVMTDNRVYLDETGRESVACNRADGWGLARLREKGVAMMVLSTEANPVVAARCAKLRLECHQGVADKAVYLRELAEKRGIDLGRIAFVGNDVNDLGCLRLVGMPVAVADSHPEVLKVARLILSRIGGDAVVREFCDAVLARLTA